MVKKMLHLKVFRLLLLAASLVSLTQQLRPAAFEEAKGAVLTRISKSNPGLAGYLGDLLDKEKQKDTYKAAVKNAEVHPMETTKPPTLFAIAPWNKELVWDQKREYILVTSVMSEWVALNIWKPLEGKQFVINTQADVRKRRDDMVQKYGKTPGLWDGYIEVWVAPAPLVYRFIQDYAGDIGLNKSALPSTDGDKSVFNAVFSRRLDQYLGLVPQEGRSQKYITEMWVRPRDLMRPCLDEEVVDDQCIMDPEREKLPAAFKDLTDYVRPSSREYKEWFDRRKQTMYGEFKGTENVFPWTRLGQTYDWGIKVPGGRLDTETHGQSEYVLKFLDKQPRSVIVRKVYTPLEYLQSVIPVSEPIK